MSASFNKVILAGNLTRDPELRYIPSGTAVTDIGMAINDRYKNSSGEWVEQTVFVDVTIWGRTAEVACEYLSKGSNVLIDGRLKFDQWEKDGQKNSKLRVTCDRMQMLGSRGEGKGEGGRSQGSEDFNYGARDEDGGGSNVAASSSPRQDDEIPF